MLLNLTVQGMSCNHCKMAVTKKLMEQDNIDKVEVDLDSGDVTVEGSDLDQATISGLIDALGYQVV
jgi:copper chaperone